MTLQKAKSWSNGKPFFQQSHFDLFLISFVILFFELACIRWFGAMVIFLTFFTNIILIACFLGMSIGCMVASRKQNYIKSVLPIAVVSTALACIILFVYRKFSHLAVDVGNQLSAELIYFGTESRFTDPAKFVIPIWLIVGIFFSLISLMFIGPGQIMGRTFNAIPNRIIAYAVNILGSIFGIVAFFVVSLFRAPPWIWFAICIPFFLYFIKKFTPVQIISAVLTLFFVSVSQLYTAHVLNWREIWSPYYKVTYDPENMDIFTNNIGHQGMISIPNKGPGYLLPYLFNRDVGRKPFRDILIIGAGSGNDVAAALSLGNSETHIDAVEIDPVILSIGKDLHPNRPYHDTRVKYYLNDGRNFLKKNVNKKYDLIIYALVDSLVLHSSYSSLRLESFLFTKEAFEDIKKRLKADGIFVMYNGYRQGWVIGRLAKMAKEVFESKPIVISIPYRDKIDLFSRSDDFVMILVGDSKNNVTIQEIRKEFQSNKSFWVNRTPKLNYSLNAFGTKPDDRHAKKEEKWLKISPSKLDTEKIKLTPTDNWPFLYLRDKKIPLRPTVEGMVVIALISVVILFIFAPVRFIRPNWQMFFLGSGFMLLETKGVVHMSLLFGSTWVVNSIVFAAILIMILLANFFVLFAKPQNLLPYYCLLIVSLFINIFVPLTYFLSLSDALRSIVSCAIIFIPIFFAGVIFSAVFKNSRRPDIDMGSNIAGVIVGGLCENLSLIMGFNYLLIIAIAFYLLSVVMKPADI